MVEAFRGLPFVDANVFLRFVLNDIPDQTSRAIRLFSQLQSGSGRAHTTDTAVFETVFVLQSFYEIPRDEIRRAILPLLLEENLVLAHRSIYPDVFALYLAQRKLSFADCFHAIFARDFSGGAIVSFDRGFDRVPGVTRIEPPLTVNSVD